MGVGPTTVVKLSDITFGLCFFPFDERTLAENLFAHL